MFSFIITAAGGESPPAPPTPLQMIWKRTFSLSSFQSLCQEVATCMWRIISGSWYFSIKNSEQIKLRHALLEISLDFCHSLSGSIAGSLVQASARVQGCPKCRLDRTSYRQSYANYFFTSARKSQLYFLTLTGFELSLYNLVEWRKSDHEVVAVVTFCKGT